MTKKIKLNSLTDGLVAYFPFNGNANDESGNGNNGIVYNAILTRDRLGNPLSCYTFEGNAYIKVVNGDQFNFVDEFSLAYWINTFDNQVAYAAHFDKSHYVGSGWAIQKADGFSNSYYIGYMQSASGSWSNNNGRAYNIQSIANTWNHLAITKQGNTVKYYLNSFLQTTEYTSSVTIATNENLPLFIGAVNNNVIARYFKGMMDDIYIYNRAINEKEVITLFNEFTPTAQPSVSDNIAPTLRPASTPTYAPTSTPTVAPTSTPTLEPTVAPTSTPTSSPTFRHTITCSTGQTTCIGTSIGDNLDITTVQDITVTGNGGCDAIIIHPNVNKNSITIVDFNAHPDFKDIIDLTNFSPKIHYNELSHSFASTAQIVTITLPNEQVIILQNQLSDISRTDFEGLSPHTSTSKSDYILNVVVPPVCSIGGLIMATIGAYFAWKEYHHQIDNHIPVAVATNDHSKDNIELSGVTYAVEENAI